MVLLYIHDVICYSVSNFTLDSYVSPMEFINCIVVALPCTLLVVSRDMYNVTHDISV